MSPPVQRTRTRLIARLDIKAPNLIKGIRLEGLRVVGAPESYSRRYYDEGLDELIYMDSVASLYDRNSLGELVKATAEKVFVPLTVGGGIRNIQDVEQLLYCGADKVAVNTAAHARPALITEIANRFGAQCMVLSIEAKQMGSSWEAFTNNGRDHTGRDVVEWAREGERLGAGEILLTSVDREGTQKGFDVALTSTVASAVSIPVIASGGMGTLDHLEAVVRDGRADAVAIAHVLHYGRYDVASMRTAIRKGEGSL